MSEASLDPVTAESRMVSAPGGPLHVMDSPGVEPALVLMHGFPDDSRIYDRLARLLAPRRVVAVDWLGYGRSGRVEPGPFDGAQHQRELRSVLDSLELGRVGLVGHDASGPDAIDFTLGQPDRVGHRMLLNTYYGHAPALRHPRAVAGRQADNRQHGGPRRDRHRPRSLGAQQPGDRGRGRRVDRARPARATGRHRRRRLLPRLIRRTVDHRRLDRRQRWHVARSSRSLTPGVPDPAAAR